MAKMDSSLWSKQLVCHLAILFANEFIPRIQESTSGTGTHQRATQPKATTSSVKKVDKTDKQNKDSPEPKGEKRVSQIPF
jgi:hypothetical protein